VAAWIVITEVTDFEPGVTVGALHVAVRPAGSEELESVTALLYEPPTGETVTVTLTEPAEVSVKGVCGAATVKLALLDTVTETAVEVEAANPELPE
jgi:hypothetical protein